MVDSDPRTKGREIINGLRNRAPALRKAFGETGVDIMTGHLAHLKNQEVREVLILIGLSRSNSLGSRFIASKELTTEPNRILGTLISSPNTYNRRARRLKLSAVEQAVGEGKLRVDYNQEIEASRRKRVAVLKANENTPLDSIAS